METNSYISELLGAVKQKETLGALAAQLTRLINPQSLGRITIRIAKPFTMSSYVDTQIAQRRYPVAVASLTAARSWVGWLTLHSALCTLFVTRQCWSI